MSNFDVNRIGKAIAERAFRKHGYHVDNGMISFDDNQRHVPLVVPLVIWTKVHQKRAINGVTHDITGKDEVHLDRLKHQTGDVVLCWVDALLGVIKFGLLSDLMQPRTFEGEIFPHVEVTHSGKIVYFNVHLLKTLSGIEEDDLNQLRDEIHHNRTPKGQESLF